MGAPIGNQNAKKAKRWQDALVKAMARYTNADKGVQAGQALDKIAEVVVEQALAGNKDAWVEIGNRLDGKPAQAITGPDGGAFEAHVVNEFITRGIKPTDSGLPGSSAGRSDTGDNP